jgi:hypothetical protein
VTLEENFMLRHFLLSALLSLSCLTAIAQQQAEPSTPTEKQFGADTVYFSVLNTSFLSPDVARSYGLVRGDKKFLINVAIRRQQAGKDVAVEAQVTGSTSDLIHRTELEFLEVAEQDALYYIASFEIDNTEKRDFRLQIQAEGQRQSYDINFNKKLYVDE